MSTTLYEKRGRRYVVWGNTTDLQRYDQDPMRAGQFRLEHCPRDGERRYRYDVTPDTAGFAAAADIARDAMEQAMIEEAKHTPQNGSGKPWTKRQKALIEKFRADMAAAGGLMPSWWTEASPHDIADAGIEAVRQWGEE